MAIGRVEGRREAPYVLLDLRRQSEPLGFREFGLRFPLLAHATEDPSQLEPCAVCIGLLGQQVAKCLGSALQVVHRFQYRSEAKPRLCSQLGMFVLREAAEDHDRACPIAAGVQLVRQCEQLSCAGLYAAGLPLAGHLSRRRCNLKGKASD